VGTGKNNMRGSGRREKLWVSRPKTFRP